MATTTDLADVAKNSAKHTDDTYWFEGFGRLNRADVVAHDREFLDACAKDPAK